MSDKITLDRDAFKVLASDTRIEMLKILSERKKTLTDLSEETGLSPSTVKEHIDRLVEAGLIEHLDRGTKWKYYVLTSKGKSIVKPVEAKIWIMLSASAAVLASLAVDVTRRINLFSDGKKHLMQVPPHAAEADNLAGEAVDRGVGEMSQQAPKMYSASLEFANQTVNATSKAMAEAASRTTTTLSSLPEVVEAANTQIPLWEVSLAFLSLSVFMVCAFIAAKRSLRFKL
ncbi:MAG: ArsR family transcriptional regulator [Candidatus Altiarchaeales archaeon]|nr:ArsR family transcriptional regulator [Candidatus Altiarchaeales archaeon]